MDINDLTFSEYVRRPFIVQAVEVTKDNIADLAPYIGQLQHMENGTPFIQVERWKVPNVSRVFVGFFVTRVNGENIRCFSKRVFAQQFVSADPATLEWVEFLNASTPPAKNVV